MATLNIKNFDDALYTKLKVRAAEQHRSIAQEVAHILSTTLAAAQPMSILELQGLGRDLWIGVNVARYVDDERASWD